MLDPDVPVVLVMPADPLAERLARQLAHLGCEPSLTRRFESVGEGLACVAQWPECVLFVDNLLPGAQEDAISRFAAAAPRACRLAVTRAGGGYPSARLILAGGADGVLTEADLEPHLLDLLLDHAWHTRATRVESQHLRHELDHLRTQLRALTTSDPVTGLSHARHFEEVLRAEWETARHSRAALSLLVIAIDDFDQWAAAAKPDAADAYLRTLAARLQAGVRRADDLAARIGRDRLAVLLPRADGPVATGVCQRLFRAFATDRLVAPANSGLPTLTMTRVTATPGADESPTTFLADALTNVNYGQRAGGNRIVDPEFLS